MTRTPDEIKKGLEEEIPVHYHIDGEPRLTPRLLMDMQWLHKDAIALIQRLEGDVATYKVINDLNNRTMDEQKAYIDQLINRVKQLEAERDAAVNFLRSMGCDTCMYDDYDGSEPPCINCTAERDYWMWRGVQKEDTTC